MRVLVLGANGFLGSAIVLALQRAGIEVRAAVREPNKFIRRFPGLVAIKVDLADEAASRPNYWRLALDGVEAVVNAAGVLQPRRARVAWAVHQGAPEALFAACETAGVRRVIQISAIGVAEAETLFARSKRAGDDALMKRDLDWTVLRPTIVIGDGSYGGTSMLRAMAACPWVTPVIGDWGTQLDVIHKDDLAAGIARLLESGAAKHAILEPASAERLTLSEALVAYRGWLGLSPRPLLAMPKWLVRGMARIGDVARLNPLTTTAVAQFEARLTGDASGFEAATGVKARSLRTILSDRAAESQDLWHARLFLLRPAVRLVLAALWLVSGLLGLFAAPERFLGILEPVIANQAVAIGLARGMGLIDLAIAAALFVGWRLGTLALVQLVLVLGYTVGLSILAPGSWLDPFGGLLKNLPIIALVLVHRVLEEER